MIKKVFNKFLQLISFGLGISSMDNRPITKQYEPVFSGGTHTGRRSSKRNKKGKTGSAKKMMRGVILHEPMIAACRRIYRCRHGKALYL